MTEARQGNDSILEEASLERSLALLVREELDVLAALGGRQPDTEKMAAVRQRVLLAEIGRRRDTGYSPSHLARILGVSRATIGRWVLAGREKSRD